MCNPSYFILYFFAVFFSGPLSKILPIRGTCVTCAVVMVAMLMLASRTTALWQFIACFSVVYCKNSSYDRLMYFSRYTEFLHILEFYFI